MSLVVVDYGVGNVASVTRAFERLGAAPVLTAEPERVAGATRIVLPGVGAFAPARRRLASSGLEAAVRAGLAGGARLLGLCLGYQLLFEESEEFGTNRGLGLLPGRVVAFPPGVRSPHIGWNRLRAPRGLLFDDVPDGSHVYFVHSYRVEGADAADVAATCDYGGPFTCSVARGGVLGCQFHPEKSSRTGRRILSNFLAEAA